MTFTRTIVALGTLAVVSRPLAAQVGAACVGPGAAFGITAYQCASCGFKRDSSGRVTYSYNAEPVVTETTPGGVWKPGDVVARIGGQPITTAEGAESFAYPFESSARIVGPLIIVDGVTQAQLTSRMAITIRRGNALLTTTQPLLDRCADSTGRAAAARDTARVRIRDWRRPPLDERFRLTFDTLWRRLNASKDTSTRLSLLLLDVESAMSRLSTAAQSRFGFALACDPSCTKTRARDGSEYWRFDGYPRVAALRPDSPAARIGLRIGDQVKEVDGVSLLTEEGSLRFLSSESSGLIRLAVLRDGKALSFVLSVQPHQ